MTHRLSAGAFACGLLFLVTSCGLPLELGCTDIGCESGLLVQLEGPVDEAYTVTIRSADSDAQFIHCDVDEACRIMFPDYAAPSVTVTYESSARTVEQRFEPDYEVLYPNGEDCPPSCVVGTVVLDLGER